MKIIITLAVVSVVAMFMFLVSVANDIEKENFDPYKNLSPYR